MLFVQFDGFGLMLTSNFGLVPVVTELGYSRSILLDSTLICCRRRTDDFLHAWAPPLSPPRPPRIHLHPTVVLIAPLPFVVHRERRSQFRVPPAESLLPFPASYPHAEQQQRYQRRRDARNYPAAGGGCGPLAPAHHIRRRQLPPCGPSMLHHIESDVRG